MKLNWRDLTVFFPHSQSGDQRRGSATSASGEYRRWARLGVMVLAVFCTAGACAQTALQQQIDAAVEHHLQQRLKAEAAAEGWKGMRFTQTSAPQSSIVNLMPCSQPLSIKAGGDNHNWSHQRFTLGCIADGWTLAVLTEVKVYVAVVVAKQVINRGEIFHSGQLALHQVDIAKLNSGFYSSLDKLIGQGAKRRIRADQLITPNLVAAALVIQRGQRVTINANLDGINASTQGEALEHGALGDVIRIRNLSSKKTIEAKVLGAGLVTSTF